MIEQIKYALRKLLTASAIVAACACFAVLADAEEDFEIYEVGVVETSEPPDGKPIVRCPKTSFLLRSGGCKAAKPVKPKAEADKQKTAPVKARVDEK